MFSIMCVVEGYKSKKIENVVYIRKSDKKSHVEGQR